VERLGPAFGLGVGSAATGAAFLVDCFRVGADKPGRKCRVAVPVRYRISIHWVRCLQLIMSFICVIRLVGKCGGSKGVETGDAGFVRRGPGQAGHGQSGLWRFRAPTRRVARTGERIPTAGRFVASRLGPVSWPVTFGRLSSVRRFALPIQENSHAGV